MNKLPFVWELKSKGDLHSEDCISHAIGSPHGLMIYASQYTKDLLQFLEDKSIVLVESNVNYGGTLDATLVDISNDFKMPIKEIASREDREAFEDQYSVYLNGQTAVEAYKQGDEEAIKKIYGAQIAPLTEKCNTSMAKESLRFFKTLKALIMVDLAHFLIEPSLLTMYKDKGIEIKKIQ